MLSQTAYGKSRIRLVQVSRRGDRHDLRDLTVAIRFEGDYDTSYTEGDNSDVLPTDTMKNTVYALAAREPVREPEAFGFGSAGIFSIATPAPQRARRHRRARLGPHRRSATASTARRSCGAAPTRAPPRSRPSRDGVAITAGVADLVILKSSHSAFAGFPRDEYTTLPDTNDRLLATSLTATWTLRRRRSGLRSELARRARDPARGVCRTRQPVGAAHAVRDGASRARHRRRRVQRSAGDAEQASSAVRPRRSSASRIATRSSSPPKSRTA